MVLVFLHFFVVRILISLLLPFFFFFFFLSFFHFLSFFSLTSAYGLRTDGLIRYYFKSYSPFFCVFYLILLYY